MRNKFVVYTALFGNYDNLIDPIKKFEGCDFICFTDQRHIKSDIWDIRIIDEIDLPSNMMNRKYKILPHLFLSEYESSMYVDSNIKILKNPIDLANKYLKQYNFVMPKHFSRNCIYREAAECVSIGKTDNFETNKQMDFYLTQGFPKDYGLGENNILLRAHNDQTVIDLMDDWWYELNTYTKRDQLSLGYVLWKNGKSFTFMNETARGNQYFKLKLHLEQKATGSFRKLYDFKNQYVYNYPNTYITKILILINKVLR